MIFSSFPCFDMAELFIPWWTMPGVFLSGFCRNAEHIAHYCQSRTSAVPKLPQVPSMVGKEKYEWPIAEPRCKIYDPNIFRSIWFFFFPIYFAPCSRPSHLPYQSSSRQHGFEHIISRVFPVQPLRTGVLKSQRSCSITISHIEINSVQVHPAHTSCFLYRFSSSSPSSRSGASASAMHHLPHQRYTSRSSVAEAPFRSRMWPTLRF